MLSIDPASEFAAIKLIAVMAWPMDENRRRGALAAMGAEAADTSQDVLDAINTGVPLQGDARAIATNAKALFELQLYEPAGGRRALTHSPPLEELLAEAQKQILVRAQTVGVVLCFAAQLGLHNPEIASLNRAWAVFEMDPSIRLTGAPVTEAQFKEKWWMPYRAVAPLYAAYHLLRAVSAPSRLRLNADELRLLLSWASWFRQWATTFQARRASKGSSLIPDGEAWIYDSPVSEEPPPLAPMNAARLKIARNYFNAERTPARTKRRSD